MDSPKGVSPESAAHDPSFDEIAGSIGLRSLESVQANNTDRVSDMVENLDHRAFGSGGKMLIGLYICFVALAEQVFEIDGRESVDNVLEEFETTRDRAEEGRTVATLTIYVRDSEDAERQVGLRALYSDFSNVARGPRLGRSGYPSSPGHTTSRWRYNEGDLKAIFAMSQGERKALAESGWELLLKLPRWERRLPPRDVRDPFAQVLRDFDRHAHKGEVGGAALQGLVYGFMAADAPTVQFRTASARTGGKRANLVGDIDGYDGPDLALTAEVKDRDLQDADDITDFYSNLGPWPDAIAFVVCRVATPQFKEEVELLRIGVYTLDQLVDQVELWIVPKQLAAIRHAMGYFDSIERKPDLGDRFEAFLRDRKINVRG
jgi:hypothetical protein